MGVLETSGKQMSSAIAGMSWWASWGREVPRDRVVLGLASRMDAPIAPIDVVDDEVEAWETASVRILCALHGSGPELHNTGPHEFQRLRMQGEIVPPREACGDFARLCSASDSQGACQCVQFFPGFCVQSTVTAPLVSVLHAKLVDGSNAQQNRSVGGRGLRARLFSTGARLWRTIVIHEITQGG